MQVYNPVSTYRLQFNKDFSFKDAEHILPYLKKLGVKTVYASPIFQAVTGSSHGYDVTNPNQLNPEIGSSTDFNQLIEKLHQLGMGWIQDIVPNHMAFSPENPWIYDVLEKGSASSFSHFFDIDEACKKSMLENKLMLPFFGKPLDELLRDKELKLNITETGLKIAYYDNVYPASLPAYAYVFSLGKHPEEPEIISHLKQKVQTNNASEKLFSEVYNEYQTNNQVNQFMNVCLEKVNSDKRNMQQLLDKLYYRPTFWKETNHTINYRRFFTVNGLICLDMTNNEVFDTYHTLVLSFIKERKIDGLRVDHIDGLKDPTSYLQKLRATCGENIYLCAEKILEDDERIPTNWPIHGTTGYDFLAHVNNLLTNISAKPILKKHYTTYSEQDITFDQMVIRSKRFMLHQRMAGELKKLSNEFLANFPAIVSEYNEEKIRKAISEILVYFPVYKLYSPPTTFSDQERKVIEDTFRKAQNDKLNSDILDALEQIKQLFLLHSSEEENKRRITDYFRHLLQYTGPLMAKGIEDTTFYTYVPFLAHNEVGDSPGKFGMNTTSYLLEMQQRHEKYPLALNCTATHDTKRGEDVRARLQVISDKPTEWISVTKQWREQNTPYLQSTNEQRIPDKNDEYLIYQSLVAHSSIDLKITQEFIQRFEAFIIKALREAKQHSSWNTPNSEYEEGTLRFIRHVLSPKSSFLAGFYDFTKSILCYGLHNALVQTILKHTAPGIPDIYQGTEIWNFDFVDPDNRKQIDYQKLNFQLLKVIEGYELHPVKTLQYHIEKPGSGAIKQLINYLCLHMREQHHSLFSEGNFIPLEVNGAGKNKLVAYMRSLNGEFVIVVLPIQTGSLSLNHKWEGTHINLPDFCPDNWENVFTKETYSVAKKIAVQDLFKQIPFAMLHGKTSKPARRAGILMHITSLPGPYGVGDFGMEAYRFVDFLHSSGQQYWQTLPLNISDKHTLFSPYCSYSAFACNTLFISPEKLIEKDLITVKDADACRIQPFEKVNYEFSDARKKELLKKAYATFKKKNTLELQAKFDAFVNEQAYWLNDYALFQVIKNNFKEKPWNEWPKEFRDREREALENIQQSKTAEIEACKFHQFLVFDQWKELKAYANKKKVKIVGDIPIYTNYDSADVWANPEIFQLNSDLSMKTVAGVPPDYFNENGQLWGMPIFNWEKLEETDFSWWITRLKKNMEWFDLVRLDHFRGFSAYWEVPADHKTALNGLWVNGPGRGLFDAIQKEFPQMPFIAEDLGQINQQVIDLRDAYSLPGMKIVQFGFGSNAAFHQHVPHNHSYNSIAYSGTHDNNTIKGWYRTEMNPAARKKFKKYTGIQLNEENCNKHLIRLTYASVSKIAIIPMQDWLGLDENSRMNFPATTNGNWLWRLKSEQLNKKLKGRIKKAVKLFGRY